MRPGFTLIEIMLVVAALSILAGVVLVAINPVRQLAEARNGARRADVATIWNATQQYMLNHPGQVPASIRGGTLGDCLSGPQNPDFTICKSESCSVTLPELVENGAYLANLPSDPSVDDPDYTGYNILRDNGHNNRITVCAPAAENGESIYLPR